ncbi:ABC transporter substrate-binding protein [Enterococcus plantarum]|uniref:ABC transporter substrate-binding protein n=1 Tax=Enterococcus plantarum TaxID=1077675 RepID=UPI00084DDA19|nr:ABC transporter substrate-binding protein [Enterococcus plantarum]OEG19086.1 ABC transporter substrate-binding protein [Enterococcus plantarum]
MKKKLVGLSIISAVALLALGACGDGKKANDGANSDSKKIGVLQPVEHGSLDAAFEGFKEGLAENGFKDGDNLTIEYSNAQNDQAQLKSMSEKLVKEKPDLLLGIATPAAQSLVNETTDIPILVTAVTDLVSAKLVKSDEKPGGNVTGTTDIVPIDKQISLLLNIVPNAKTVGIMYNAGEANSKIQADMAEKALKDAGINSKVLTANSTNDVQQVTTSLAKDVDAIYIPTDNTFASAAAVIGEVAKEHKIPVIAGSIEQVEEGGLATVGIDYQSLGKQTGAMAAKILKGEAKPAEMPVEKAKDLTLFVNKDMAKALDIDPDTIKAP